jgi:tetratricopeptide (TPR) repeat protein
VTKRRAVGVLALLLVVTLQSAQAPPPPGSPAEAAARALDAGRYDEVERILEGATDPRSVALRARAHIERGRYEAAEKLLGPVAAAQPGSDAALELGLLQSTLGRPEASQTLERLMARVTPRTSADFLRLALAARALGEFEDANGFFGNANRLTPDDAVINAAWGEMLLEKHNAADAMQSFQLALKADADHVPALVGLARALLDENPPAARAALDRALKTNPSSVAARLLLAEMAIDDRKHDVAREAIGQALRVNPRSLEALALDAAISAIEDRTDDFERQVREVLAINPSYGEVFRIAGAHMARRYRFDDAVALVRRALTVGRPSARTSAELGLQSLRTGDEAGARVAFERAFKEDPYDRETFFALALLDYLDKFETIVDGDIVMRLHADQVGVMREQALPLAQEAVATLEKRWDFKVRGPILIEIFPRGEDFEVRTFGLPGFIGALGACFGRVVTMRSPRSQPPIEVEFNWRETLWHEIAHVITLQMSDNRVPRWLSEGVSVWEERRARPEWGRETEVAFAQAMNENRVVKLDAIGEAFGDPRTISLAYHQASLVVEHLALTYGEPSLRALLRAFGRGLETDAAFKDAFGVTLADVQASFDARIEKQYAGLRRALRRPDGLAKTETAGKKEPPSLATLKALAADNPDSFPVQMQLAEALHKAGDRAGAIEALERADRLLPGAPGDNNPNGMLAAIALEQGDTARAVRALEALVRVNHTDVAAARKLASLLSPQTDPGRAQDAYQRVVAIDPFDAGAQSALGHLLLGRKDAQGALQAFRSALAAGPTDRAAAHADLAEAYLMAGQPADARRQALAALEIAPSFERAQDLLLQIVEADRK